jgi:nitric oxide synthase oxygenase domain/subunit
MGTVGIAWSGRCQSTETRLDLLKFIIRLARLNQRFFEQPPLAEKEKPIKPPQFTAWNGFIKGRIMAEEASDVENVRKTLRANTES